MCAAGEAEPPEYGSFALSPGPRREVPREAVLLEAAAQVRVDRDLVVDQFVRRAAASPPARR